MKMPVLTRSMVRAAVQAAAQNAQPGPSAPAPPPSPRTPQSQVMSPPGETQYFTSVTPSELTELLVSYPAHVQ